MNLVDAQQTRRILDRMVGYEISPVLWAKVKEVLVQEESSLLHLDLYVTERQQSRHLFQRNIEFRCFA